MVFDFRNTDNARGQGRGVQPESQFAGGMIAQQSDIATESRPDFIWNVRTKCPPMGINPPAVSPHVYTNNCKKGHRQLGHRHESPSALPIWQLPRLPHRPVSLSGTRDPALSLIITSRLHIIVAFAEYRIYSTADRPKAYLIIDPVRPHGGVVEHVGPFGG